LTPLARSIGPVSPYPTACEEIPWPAYTEKLDHELAAIIGRRGKNISKETAFCN
jgi:2-keto-4-pentenoate hydratase/2-oxohepta-3-ene-1,7-dioic acid hydratase in catechol pathway